MKDAKYFFSFPLLDCRVKMTKRSNVFIASQTFLQAMNDNEVQMRNNNSIFDRDNEWTNSPKKTCVVLTKFASKREGINADSIFLSLTLVSLHTWLHVSD